MDQNVPLGVSENTLDGFIKSKELIDQWHNKGRLSYAVTPDLPLHLHINCLRDAKNY